jgi:hypothetical protein
MIGFIGARTRLTTANCCSARRSEGAVFNIEEHKYYPFDSANTAVTSAEDSDTHAAAVHYRTASISNNVRYSHIHHFVASDVFLLPRTL